MRWTTRARWSVRYLAAVLVWGAGAWAATPPAYERPHFEISRSAGLDLAVDGRLDETAWRDALVIPLAWEWDPGDGVAPPVRTEALVLFDETRLYVGFRAFDPEPAEIRAHLMDRDSLETLAQDDTVSFKIDTFGDQRRAFLFRVNPLGVQADAQVNGVDGSEDFSWDAVWDSAAHIGPDGWVAEVSIPFHQLRFPKSADSEAQTWGLDFRRSYPRRVRYRMAAHYVDPANNCDLCQVPRITGFEGMRTGWGLEVVPTIVFDRTDAAQAIGGDLVEGDEDAEAGLSVRWNPSSNVTLNAAVNPDFSQVEADAVELAVNERFALFFPEKRPFFLEGADIFTTPIELLFTRTIVDPEWGLKLTGKSGDSAFGFFTADDDVNTITVPTSDATILGALSGGVSTSVGRWRRDVGESSTAGVLVADRQGENGYFNRLVSADTSLRFGSRHALQVQGAVSDTRYPENFARLVGQPLDDFEGHAFQAFYAYETRDWFGSFGYRDYSADFRADMGFVPRVGFETWRGEARRTFWDDQDEDWLVQSSLGLLAIDTRGDDGEILDRVVGITGSVVGAQQSRLTAYYENRDEAFVGSLFEDMRSASLDFDIQPSGSVRLGLVVVEGDTIEIREVRRADNREIAPRLELKLGDHFNFRLDLTRQDLEVESGRLYRADVAESRLVYQFNVRTFVRAILQYVEVDRNPEHYLGSAPPDVEEAFGQFLFSYKLNPRTLFFAGYSESRLGRGESDLERVDRTFFVKIGYAWLR